MLWIVVPLLTGALIAFVPRERTAAIQAGMVCALLALIALLVPVATALALGPFSLKIAASVRVLGRSFIFGPADGPILASIYGIAALWFFGAVASSVGRRFVPLGLSIVALLVASIAVDPFLFAAPLIMLAAMLAVPMMVLPGTTGVRGTLRFLIHQTLAVPLILFSGWMLAGVEASPGDIALTSQAGILLALGFSFLLAIFPLYSWIPMLAEETSPYVLGFVLWALPTFAVVFALGFLDRYAWLRTSPQLVQAVRLAGLVMLVTGGWFAAFQRHLGRMMAYAAVAETGLAILALTLGSLRSAELVFLLFIPRGIELTLWSLALSIFASRTPSLRFRAMQGLARTYPIAAAGIVLAHLSMSGLPMLAGFPSRFALWQELARRSIGPAIWVLIGLVSLLFGGLRSLAVLVMAPAGKPWQSNENRVQALMLGVAITGLFIVGLFPQTLQVFLRQLPLMFEHLAE